MKKILFLLSAVLMVQNVMAQKVDLDKFTFKSSLTTFPENYVEPSMRTYDIQVTMSPELSGFAKSTYENLTLDGYTYSSTNPTVLTYVNVNRVKLVSSDIKSRVVEDKDKDGKVKSSKTYYYVEAVFNGLGDYKVSGPVNPYKSLKELGKESKKNDKKKEKVEDNPFLKDAGTDAVTSSSPSGMKLETKSYNMTKEYRYTGTSYNSYTEASRSWDLERERKLYEYKGQYINDFFAAISSTLRYKYGYPITSDMYHLWILDSKSHPEYETQQKAIEAVKVLMPKLNGNADTKSLMNDLKPVLDYFKSLPAKYPADEKADKKMRYSAYYNLAKLYYLFDDAQSCIEYANLLIKNDYDTEDGEKFLDWAEELKNQFSFYKTDTRQAVK